MAVTIETLTGQLKLQNYVEVLETTRKIAESDKEVDDGLDVVMRQLITFTLEDSKVISSVLDAILAARALERIGDHNRNICENIIYLVEGIDIRNTTPEQQ